MQSDNGIPPTPPTNGAPPYAPPGAAPAVADPGLPPVAPPSGKFILQLFLVPGLIVGLLLFAALALQWFMGGSRSPAEFLTGLDDSNPEVRWRTAADLSQVLPRDGELAANVGFGLDLAQRLRTAVEDSAVNERARLERSVQAKHTEAEEARDLKALEPGRKYIAFLTGCLGYFRVPVGAPLLCELARPQSGLEPDALRHRRQDALFALTLLGNSLSGFDALKPARQQELLQRLAEEAQGEGERANWARQARDYLLARRQGRPSAALGVPDTLVQCALDKHPLVRKLAAQALTFWDESGEPPAQTAAHVVAELSCPGGTGLLATVASLYPGRATDLEATLLRLARDDGHGATKDGTGREGRDIRYGAVLALARHGSSAGGAFLPTLAEMLDFDKQKRWCGPPEEKNAAEVVRGALKAVQRLHQKVPRLDLSALQPALADLIKGANKSLAEEALETQLELKR